MLFRLESPTISRVPKILNFVPKSQDRLTDNGAVRILVPPGIDAEQVARVVLALLAERLSATELEDVRAVTPKALRALWPI